MFNFIKILHARAEVQRQRKADLIQDVQRELQRHKAEVIKLGKKIETLNTLLDELEGR